MFGYIQQNETTPLFIAIRSYTCCEWPDCRRHRNSSCSVYVWCDREGNCDYDTILCIFLGDAIVKTIVCDTNS